MASAALLRHDADPWLDTAFGATLPPLVSWKISWPPLLGPMPRVPAETYVFPPWVKKSTSVCGLPVAKVFSSSHFAPGPPEVKACAGGVSSWIGAPAWSRARPRLWPAIADAGVASMIAVSASTAVRLRFIWRLPRRSSWLPVLRAGGYRAPAACASPW